MTSVVMISSRTSYVIYLYIPSLLYAWEVFLSFPFPSQDVTWTEWSSDTSRQVKMRAKGRVLSVDFERG